MKKGFELWLKTFFVTTLVFTLISLSALRRLNLQLPFLRLIIGAMIIALLLMFGILVFRLKKGNQIVNTILGFLIILPSVGVMRTVFGALIFRWSFVIYVFVALIAIIYSVAVVVVSKRIKSDVDTLNKLLAEKNAEATTQETPKND